MTDNSHHPVAIVGAGPAGVSAALWLRSYNLDAVWFGDGDIGGMLHRVHNAIDNYPGRRADDGADLADALRDHVDTTEMRPTPRRIDSIEATDRGWALYTDGHDDQSEPTARARTVIIATGTRYRRLGVPGEADGLGSYVHQSVARGAERWADQTVAMVGGGDSAFEGALRLSDQRCRVHLLIRSAPKARRDFRERVRQDSNIMVHPIPTLVDAIEPLPFDRGARLRVTTRDHARSLEVASVFVRIGYVPTLPDISPAPDTDETGYICVDREQRSSVDRLYAAGDVTDAALPAVATAVGDAARAAHTAAVDIGHKST
jgi:thioredoxin reductase (NADPH)